MNVVFVNSTRKWGGVKTWCLNLARRLDEAGHRAWIFGRPGPFVDKALAMGLRARPFRFGPDYNPLAIAAFAAFFRRRAVDAVVVNVGKDMRTAGLAARLLGIPVVHRIGAPGDLSDSWQIRLTQRLVAPRLLCCSEFVKAGLRQAVPLMRRCEVEAIHPGTPVQDRPTATTDGPPLIIATSQLNEDKRHEDLLRALARLKDEGLEFRGRIVGTGRLEEWLKGLTRDLGLDDRVSFAGFTTDVAAELRRADIFVLPTWCEPLGIALEEAMAHGLVPVARNAGGAPEIWPPDLRDLLVPQDSGADGFRAVLGRLLALSPDELAGLKRAAHAHARVAVNDRLQAEAFIRWLQADPTRRASADGERGASPGSGRP